MSSPSSVSTKPVKPSAPALSRLGWVAALSLSSTAALAFQYSVTDLGTLPGGTFSFATDINSAGWVVGYANTGDGHTHAFLYNGALEDLGTLGGNTSVAQSILEDGTVLGYSAVASGELHVFGYDGTMVDLGLLRGTLEQSLGIPTEPEIFGGITDTDGYNLAIVNDGSVRELGTLGGRFSYALDTDPLGNIVGYAETSDLTQHAFLYRDNEMVDLNDLVSPLSGWVLRSASAINDQGQIVGYGTLQGQTRAFLLSPTVQAVPEAGTGVAALAVVVAAAGAWLRRRY